MAITTLAKSASHLTGGILPVQHVDLSFFLVLPLFSFPVVTFPGSRHQIRMPVIEGNL
jgi:hypothetical protein